MENSIREYFLPDLTPVCCHTDMLFLLLFSIPAVVPVPRQYSEAKRETKVETWYGSWSLKVF